MRALTQALQAHLGDAWNVQLGMRYGQPSLATGLDALLARPLERLVIMNVPHPGVFAKILRTSPAQRRKSWYIAFFQLPARPL